MKLDGVCLNCFSMRGAYDVCPYCGFVAGSFQNDAYLLVPGTVLQNRYVIGTVLGVGGFGVTYRALDTTLSIIVAIKEFYPQGLVNRIPGEAAVRAFSGDKQTSYTQQLARFLDEARNMAKFAGDRHIVNVFDFFEANNTAYIVMEYLDGQTLKEHIQSRGGRLAADEAIAITSALLEALVSVHRKGVIHRDISPDNVFILRDGQVKVLDFGAARFNENENPALTQAVVIKMGYAPPEQYRANMKQGVWTDIYATGATLYKMLTGITPDESVDRIEKDILQRPSKLGIPTGVEVEKTIMKAMALKPELRFKSAEAMLDALLNKSSVDFPEEELKKRRRMRAVLVVASVAAVLGIAVLVGMQSTRKAAGGGINIADIAPVSIEVAIPPGHLSPQYEELVEVFNEQYPEHQVKLVATETTHDETSGKTSYSREEQLPAVFYSRAIELSNTNTADLTPLVQALGTRDYWLLDRYEEIYPEKDKMPIDFDCMLAFGNTSRAQQQEIELPKQITSVAQLSNTAGQGKGGTIRANYYTCGYMLASAHPDFAQGEKLADATIKDMAAFAELGSKGYLFTASLAEAPEDCLLNIGWLFEFRAVQKNWPGQYTLIPVCLADDGGMLGYASTEWSVNADATKDEQKLGMLFIHFLLSDYAQNILYLQDDQLLPLNKASLDKYGEINPEMAVLNNNVMDKMHFYAYNDIDKLEGVSAFAGLLADGCDASEMKAEGKDWRRKLAQAD